MENLEYRQRKSRKFVGFKWFTHSKIAVGGDLIGGIKERRKDIGNPYESTANKVFVLNRWTLKLEKVSNAFVKMKKFLIARFVRSLKPEYTANFGQ